MRLAKETYKSILDNYQKNPNDGEDLKMIAKQKLDAILSDEEKRNKDIQEEKMKLNPALRDSTDGN